MSHLSEEALVSLAEQERNRAGAPITNWESLSAQLREEGIIRESGSRRISSAIWLRSAAAVLLIAGGALVGRYTAGDLRSSSPSVAARPAMPSYESQASQSAAPGVPFRSVDEAYSVLNRAGAEYQRASAYLASRDASGTIDSTSVYQARLAALDGMTAASHDALYEAPHDPVINQYYLAAMGAREATLRQLSTSLPSGVRLAKW